MNSREVFEKLEYSIGKDGRPQRLRDAIETVVVQYFGLAAIQAAEEAEKLERPVKDMIRRKSDQQEMEGRLATLKLSSVSDSLVSGSCYVEPSDSASVAAAKANRRHVQRILEQILSMNFAEFEVFGQKVLYELGAREARVTPQSNDQGIDFYGILSLGQFSLLPEPFGKIAHDVSLSFAGQAKFYRPNKKVESEAIRELIGAVSLARYKVFTIDKDLFEDIKLLSFTPLVTMIFTTTGFTKGALDLAEKTGIIARTGEQLAVFLADREVGIRRASDGTPNFDAELFRAWLEK